MAYLCREGEEQSAAKRAQEREILVNEIYCNINANASMKMASVDRQIMCKSCYKRTDSHSFEFSKLAV